MGEMQDLQQNSGARDVLAVVVGLIEIDGQSSTTLSFPLFSSGLPGLS